MPDRYSEAEVELMRAWRAVVDGGWDRSKPWPEPMPFDPSDSGRWIATVDAIKAERDRAVEALAHAEGALWRIAKGVAGRRADGETSNETDWQIARTALARVGKGGA